MSAAQNDRVLRALEQNPARGITQVDFSLPDVIDGGKPITRVAARIQDLEEAGYTISGGERRNRCVVYRLVGAASETERAPGGPPTAPAAPASPRPALGSFHACERCAYMWRGKWPRVCPSCNARTHYIASFHTREACESHEPLMLATHDERAAA